MRIENSRVLSADRVGDLLLHFENLRARLNQRVFETRDLIRNVSWIHMIVHNVIALDREHMDGSTRDARRCGHAVATLFLVAAIAAHSGVRITGASTILR